MTFERQLIVNADDFGLCAGVNQGIVQAHECGIVTSASLMVRWPHAPAAAEYARAHPALSLGLHVDLGEWVLEEGEWTPLYQVVPDDDEPEVAAELIRQLETFRTLVGADPTHLDSHQHLHRSEPLRTRVLRLAAELEVPLRHFDPRVRYCGSFYGQDRDGSPLPDAIAPEGLIGLLRELPEGVTELCCHPGLSDGLASPYLHERVRELRTLCDPRVRDLLHEESIRLCSFRDLPR